jgi:hypothetical protein
MADIIRNEHSLTTLRLSFRREPSSAKVVFTLQEGKRSLASFSTEAGTIGIAPELEVSSYERQSFALPDAFGVAMKEPLASATDDGNRPLWLQIDRSAGFLAIVPWERLLLDTHPSWMLRVPNFAVPPRFALGPLRVVLCASSPRAKTAFDVFALIEDEIDALQGALPASEIHVFADGRAYGSVVELAEEDLDANHRVLVHLPPERGAFGSGRSLSGLQPSSHLASPWLLWIQDALGGRTIDYCHFLTQGYFRDSRGALALAREPSHNVDAHWSHFVASDELHRFLNALGAWSVGFTQPRDDVWALGLRLLADEIAWRRPGPVLCRDHVRSSPEDLAQTYRFLFHPTGGAPVASGGMSVYAHPLRLPENRNQDEFVIEFVPDDDTMQVMTPLDPSIEIGGLRGRALSPTKEQWQASAHRLFEDAVSRVARTSGGAREGGQDALRFISGLLDEM